MCFIWQASTHVYKLKSFTTRQHFLFFFFLNVGLDPVISITKFPYLPLENYWFSFAFLQNFTSQMQVFLCSGSFFSLLKYLKRVIPSPLPHLGSPLFRLAVFWSLTPPCPSLLLDPRFSNCYLTHAPSILWCGRHSPLKVFSCLAFLRQLQSFCLFLGSDISPLR